MDMSMERESSALGSLFQQIINDMKNTSPLWEDFVAKASKLHACLRAAIQAIAAYLDAFQKIADAATNSRGASKEIGTALTRVCLRHKAVETRLKTFTAAIMDCLVQPLQDKLEDWKRSVATIDKEHAKEYKRCRTELKKRSTDTLRLQKKARKGQSDTLQSLMDSHMQDVTLRRAELEEVEKKSLRSAMVEERMRYCNFVNLLQPVVKEECEVMSELGHLQEAMESIALVTKEPHILPAASEELIHDAKASIILYPESPSTSGGGGGSLSQGGCSNSLGSRKSSVCSISSMNSSGSSNSPGHPHYPRSLSQLISPSIRLKPGESSDSGFCSSPALTTQASSIANPSHAVTTWPTHSQDVVDLAPNATDRPHTISSAYEKGHQRPPLTVYTFQNPETIHEGGGNPLINNGGGGGGSSSGQNTPSTQKSPASALNRPPLPVRCSSLERPLVANNNRGNGPNLMQRQCPSPIPAHVTKELAAHLAQQQLVQQQQQQSQQQPIPHNQQQQQQQSSPPTYVNMSELANMAAMKITNLQQQQQQQMQSQQQQSSPPSSSHQQSQGMLQQQHSIDSISSIHSNDSNQSPQQQQHHQQHHNNNQTPPPTSSHHPTPQRSHSSSSTTPSLHSHASIDSTVATPPIGQTPTHSSGSSTPQNHYSPLLNNSMSSTAAGTPSGSSIASGAMSMSGGAAGVGSGGGAGSGNNSFVYNVCSPTPPLSANSSQASDILKITETDGTGVQLQQQTHQTPPTNNNTNSSISESIAQQNANCSRSSNSPCGNTQEISTPHSADPDASSGIVVENDERSRASVLQKASMFEKQAAAAVKSTPTPIQSSSSSTAAAAAVGALTRHSPAPTAAAAAVVDSGIYGTRTTTTNSHHTAQQSQPIDPQEVDKCFEDSLQELNNLIGELDSFQREIDASKQEPQPLQLAKNVKNLYDGLDSYNCNETMTIITDDNSTTIICESSQQQLQHQPDKDFCTASNQTNSSGCGTDISDTTSEDCNADTRSLTSQTGGVLMKNNLKALSGGVYNSDSELSRCYVSETSSIMGGAGDGYENPTFAHFAVSSTAGSQCYDDNRSDTLSLQRHGYAVDNMSDNGSNVVVIYDHQPPITPDIDYVKQNSEIVMLRTKPQQQQMGHYGQQEMRELQQLPSNLTESPSSPTGSDHHGAHQHVATVQPAKQRLSSFRASSEQLQLLNSPTTPSTKAVATSATMPLVTAPNSDTIIRKKLPPKPPGLTVFQGNNTNAHIEVVNNGNNRRSLKTVQPPCAAQLDFKSDLEAKILKQKEKLKKQQGQQYPTQQSTNPTTTTPPPPPQQTSCPGNANNYTSNSNHHSINCNSPPTSMKSSIKSLESCSTTSPTPPPPPPSSSSASSATSPSSYASNHSDTTPSSSLSSPSSNHSIHHNHHHQHQHQQHHHHPPHHHQQLKHNLTTSSNNSTHIYSKSSLTATTHQHALSKSSSSSPSLNVVSPPLPPPLPPSHHHDGCSSSVLYNNTSPAPSMLATVAKPSITPRPASLSSGSTRIARRSSVNTAKPPPPVRRSSSVTPSPNTPTTPTNSSTTNMLHQQTHSLNTSTENLPPPPPYLLDGRQPMPPTIPPAGMPNSSQKVSDTVKALAAGLRHQPASPQTLRRLQQQQQQQMQQMATSPPPALSPQPPSMLQPPKQYQHQYTKSSPVLLSPTTTKKPTTPLILPQSSLVTDLDEIPPPLPPPNPNHRYPNHQQSHPLRYQQHPQQHLQQQQQQQQQQLPNHHHVQHEQQQQQDYYNNGEAIYGSNSPTSFRTSSPGGIYAQPKILNNMSSFRTTSPGPNGHQTPTQSHVPAQPKTNPNLIAQLNARLNSKQQTSSNEAIYGVSQPQTRDRTEDIYMRNYGQQSQQTQHQMSPHVSQQQQTYDAAHHPQTAANQQQPPQRQPLSQSPQLPQQQQQQSLPHAAQHQQSHYQSGYHTSQREQTQQHYTCPPPLEDPPPPPIHSNNNSATMPKRSSNHHQQQQHPSHQPPNLAAYAAASSASTLPRNMMQQQQRLQQQQQQQHQQGQYGTTHAAQQQQYHAPAGISAAHQQAQQQYQSPQNISQRPPMPLPHHPHQQHQPPPSGNRQRTASISSTKQHPQPPIPSRHSSVQQKIFVATNPFIQTTTIHCHSPSASSVHSQPASPICNSPTPTSIASIYGTSSRRSSGSGVGSNAGAGGHYDGMGGNGGPLYYNHHHQQSSSSSANTTGSSYLS